MPAAATYAAGAKNVKIDRIELFPVRYPTVAYFKFFEGPGGNYGRAAVIVKMTASDGTVGWDIDILTPAEFAKSLEILEQTVRGRD